MRLTRKKLDALIKDEHDASAEYKKLGFISLARDEKEHELFLRKVRDGLK